MKNLTKLIISLFILLTAFSANVSADSSEKAQVIKSDKNKNDLIIQRADGTKWLIQHSPMCTSMTTEFPVSLILVGDKITELKVNFNEICKVFNAVPYSGEGSLIDIIRSDNQLVADHVAQIIWNSKKYLIDYGKGCPYLYDFAGKKIYYYFSENPDKGGQIVLPGKGGQCPFTFTKMLEVIPSENPASGVALTGLLHQAQNNQVYFYWDKVTTEGKWLYVISYSKYKLDLDTYKTWKEMPNAKAIQTNSYTVRNLANGRPYYFYIAVMENGKEPGPWTEVTATCAADKTIKNSPDPEKFEVLMEDKSSNFRLYWPIRTDARRYYVRFYADAKLEFFKILKTENNEILIPKDKKYLNKGLRLEVRTMPFPNKPAFSDGLYWKYEIKK